MYSSLNYRPQAKLVRYNEDLKLENIKDCNNNQVSLSYGNNTLPSTKNSIVSALRRTLELLSSLFECLITTFPFLESFSDPRTALGQVLVVMCSILGFVFLVPTKIFDGMFPSDDKKDERKDDKKNTDSALSSFTKTTSSVFSNLWALSIISLEFFVLTWSCYRGLTYSLGDSKYYRAIPLLVVLILIFVACFYTSAKKSVKAIKPHFHALLCITFFGYLCMIRNFPILIYKSAYLNIAFVALVFYMISSYRRYIKTAYNISVEVKNNNHSFLAYICACLVLILIFIYSSNFLILGKSIMYLFVNTDVFDFDSHLSICRGYSCNESLFYIMRLITGMYGGFLLLFVYPSFMNYLLCLWTKNSYKLKTIVFFTIIYLVLLFGLRNTILFNNNFISSILKALTLQAWLLFLILTAIYFIFMYLWNLNKEIDAIHLVFAACVLFFPACYLLSGIILF